MQNTNRLQALEGLRGLAAISVVVYHALLMFYPSMLLGLGGLLAPVQNSRFEDNAYGNPLEVFISGSFAVSVFFVLSGFVLSIGYFHTQKVDIVKKLAAKRYLRLMIPALASVMIAWLLLSLHLSYTAPASSITHSGWLSSMWAFAPNLFDAIKQGVWGIFFANESYYNPVLWTMFYEFSGSFIVFVFLLLFGSVKKRAILYPFLLIATFHTWFFGFIIGLILSDLYARRMFPFDRSHVRMGIILGILAIIFGGYPYGSVANTFYASFVLQGSGVAPVTSFFTALGAGCLIISIFNVPKLEAILASSRISSLGKYTYSLYLIHKPILFSLGAGLFVLFDQALHLSFGVSVFVAMVISAPVIVVATKLFERYIDAPSIEWSGIFANWLLGLPQKKTAAYTTVTEPSKFHNFFTKIKSRQDAMRVKR